MKKILLLVVTMLATMALYAQGHLENSMSLEIPTDPDLRHGKLENGLTYYIKHNKYPENRADFYIAQKVGSMQEEDDQAGLAHFLEHMAFNGTKHYPGRKTLLNYLETVGAKFGANVNAYTGFDETVYILTNIPLTRQAIIDSTLLVLHDWSGYLELTDKEIDNERPIIKEEWRTRSGASFRIWEKQLPVIFNNSKYADRLPIGKMSVVENFEYQTLRDYYHRWYRPDLQAIIVVGDIDVDKIEAQVKEMFSGIPMPNNPEERIYHGVPDNEEPIISIVTDKEENMSKITYYIKHEPIEKSLKSTEAGYTIDLTLDLAATMLSNRLSDISKTAESPFTASFTYDGNFFASKSKDAWTSIVLSKEGKEEESLAAIIRETERAKRFGFTDTELERAKANFVSKFEQLYNNRDKQQNKTYVQEYVRSFSDGEPIPGIGYEYEMVQRLLPTITTRLLNGIVVGLLSDKNNIFTITAPEKEGLILPTESEIRNTITEVRAEEIAGYMEEIITEPLISQIPTAGDIVNKEHNKELDTTTWTLSNGMKITFKKTDYKNDEIIMSSSAYGGMSIANDKEIYEAGLLSHIPYWGGIGNFNSADLQKVLSGKNANINLSIGQRTHAVTGRSSTKDLETMLQLTYLYFTAPRKDEAMFSNFKTSMAARLKNLASDPDYIFNENVNLAKYKNNPRFISMKSADVENLDYDNIIRLYKELLANPGSFTFSFTGNIDEDVLEPLVKTYLASLPAGNKEMKYKEIDTEYRKGNFKNTFDAKMMNPKTQAFVMYSGSLKFDAKNTQYVSALKQILDIAYTRSIREEAGGTYGVRVASSLNRIPAGETILMMSFDTDKEKINQLMPLIHSELTKIANEGPLDEDFNKTKEYMLKKYSEDIKTNGYWSFIITTNEFYNDDTHSSKLNILQNMNKKDIQAITKELLDQGNTLELIMNPLAE